MAEMRSIPIKDLSLDLRNFRTVKQTNELEAVRAMISTSPDRFWALAESLLDSGFLPTENVIVLQTGAKSLTVREGNRRVGALKLMHSLIPVEDIPFVPEIGERIRAVTRGWLKANRAVPCVVYDADEADVVARIVTLAHGKGEKAGRDQWNAVARARHNRDENSASEPGLDLLEKYLEHGRNITDAQAARWAGEFPLSVLEEAMKRLSPRLGLKGAPAVASAYPSIVRREALERIVHDIGMKQLTFPILRQGDPLSTVYGIVLPPQGGAAGAGTSNGSNSGTPATGAGSSSNTAGTVNSSKKPKAVPINDLRSVKKALMKFTPLGENRDKVAALKKEATLLKIDDTPMAFCFLLRSMFELSAKAYVHDHKTVGGPALKKPDGKDKTLAELLRDITKHLIGSGTAKDKELEKSLHGASAELGSKHGFLSVTSLNQLVHNQTFSVAPQSIAIMFNNVFPLLQAMNS